MRARFGETLLAGALLIAILIAAAFRALGNNAPELLKQAHEWMLTTWSRVLSYVGLSDHDGGQIIVGTLPFLVAYFRCRDALVERRIPSTNITRADNPIGYWALFVWVFLGLMVGGLTMIILGFLHMRV